MKTKTKEQAEKIFNKYGYTIVSEYKSSKTFCECNCLKCGFLISLRLHHIDKRGICKNCVKIYIINFFKEKGCILLDEPSCTKSMKYICFCGSESKIRWYNFKHGERCKKCSINKIKENSPRRLKVLKIADKEFEKKGCKLLETNYINQSTPMKYVCSCGNEATITWKSFKRGHRCPNCAKEKISKRYIPSGKNHCNWNPNREEVELNKKVRSKIKNALRRTLRLFGKAKVTKTFEILEYSREELVQHIINHPLWKTVKDKNWELDHYFPIKAFVDYGIYDEKKINMLENLRPVDKITNRKKNDKYDKQEFEKWINQKSISIDR